MKTTERLKQQIFKEVQASGLFKEVQSKLKSQVLNLVDKQSNNNKKQIGFQYEHPLLNKLKKYPLTSLCMDLIQQFLESFKFKYTLSVFKKEINRQFNIDRLALANNFQVQMKNPQVQAVLLTLVSQLVSGDIKMNPNKQSNAFASTNKIQSNNNQPRINNFIGNSKPPEQNTNVNFNKKPTYGPQDTSEVSMNDKSKSSTSSLNNSISQQQKSSINTSSNNNQSNSQTPSSSVIDQSIKPSDNSISEAKVQSEVKEDKNQKSKKKKQVQKPPEGATDLMGELMNKFKTNDAKAEEQKKNKIFQEKRVFSQQKAKKVVDPSESGANKIRGVSMGKMSSFMNKFMPQATNTAKYESYVEEQMDQFQQSKDSTRKNPLYQSNESGIDKSNYYDVSVDSNAINDFQYVERAKKFGKK